ncbi:MAG TPA: TetR/AcrR family transcriptional regulator [Gaiellaceae bacterium]|nr:TetR/AcrR family transcriptional regulator [Gaiellaceae bacterium]
MPKVSEAHREERRRQILDGARRAFAEHGYEGATVDVLEAEIGLSRGAIFNYFPSKLELFVALAEHDQLQLAELWLREGFEGVVQELGNDPGWVGPYLDVPRMLRTDEGLRSRWFALNPELETKIVDGFRDLQGAGKLRADLPAETLVRFFSVVFDGLAVQQGARFGIDVDGTLELIRSAVAPK